MKSRVFLISCVSLISFSALAQSDSLYSKASYFLSIHSGGLFGKKGNGSSLTVTLLQGVRYKRFAFGAGIGYDAYPEWRTMPLFGSIGYDLTRVSDKAFFIQINAGHSVARYPKADEDQFTYTEDGGFLFHPQVGYRIQNGKMKLFITAGYKIQSLNYEQTPKWWIWGWPSGKVFVHRDIERISLQIGFGLR